jgi:hypothetical protein
MCTSRSGVRFGAADRKIVDLALRLRTIVPVNANLEPAARLLCGIFRNADDYSFFRKIPAHFIDRLGRLPAILFVCFFQRLGFVEDAEGFARVEEGDEEEQHGM